MKRGEPCPIISRREADTGFECRSAAGDGPATEQTAKRGKTVVT